MLAMRGFHPLPLRAQSFSRTAAALTLLVTIQACAPTDDGGQPPPICRGAACKPDAGGGSGGQGGRGSGGSASGAGGQSGVGGSSGGAGGSGGVFGSGGSDGSGGS